MGSTSTKMLRGLMERQAGCHPKSDETLLQHIAQLLHERDAKTHTQAQSRAIRNKARRTNENTTEHVTILIENANGNSAAALLAAHFLAASPDTLADKLERHTPGWQHKNTSELCTLLAHFKRTGPERVHQAPARTGPTTPPAPPVYRVDPNYSQPPTYARPNPRPGPPPCSRNHPLYRTPHDKGDACFRCGQLGHWCRECPDGRRGPRGRGRPARGRPT